jgi:hypothetical protein
MRERKTNGCKERALAVNVEFAPLTPKRRFRWRTVGMWLLLTILIMYSYAFIMATTTDGNDQAECQSLVSAVRSRHGIPLSVSRPGSPAIFCDLGVHFPFLQSYDSVFIYGELDHGEQGSIVVDVRSAAGSSRTRPILVQFFEKENWKMWSDPATGRSGGSRGPETPIRKVWIDRSNTN